MKVDMILAVRKIGKKDCVFSSGIVFHQKALPVPPHPSL